MKHSVIAIILTAALLLAAGTVPVLAQNFQGMNTLQNIASEGQTAGKYVVNIAFVFCLIPAGIKAFKGESQSKDAITSVGLGLIAIFVILAIIKAIMAFT